MVASSGRSPTEISMSSSRGWDATINRTFAKALAGKATSDGCTIRWECGEDGNQRQRLTWAITFPNGEQTTVTGLYDGRADLVAATDQLAGDVSLNDG
jgi:hypothetical protein